MVRIASRKSRSGRARPTRPVARPHGPTAPDVSAVGLVSFLGGFFTGEGSFSLDGRAVACIHVRADDAPLLRMFHERFRLGRIGHSTPQNANPSVRWNVCRQAELPHVIALLDAACLRGRKRREFEAWRIGATEYARGPERDERVVESAASALREARTYVEREFELPSLTSGRMAYVDVLKAFADESSSVELTATAYEAARSRHPEWPTRSTIAIAFGGWAQALEAAGLESRVSDRALERALSRARSV
jgi:hypothetical protein